MIAQIPRLPEVLKPPDDPLHLLLDAQVGWRNTALAGMEESPDDGALNLSPKPASGRPLVDAAGTFGGLALPTGMAVDARGGIYLLDTATGKIKRFDPCECRFENVPCTGGIGSAPRQLHDPHGMAVLGGNLFVCDTGNQRVQVFALKGMTLRTLWQMPAASGLAQPWQPYDIAFDARGRAFISDYANGVVHRLDRRGNYQTNFGTLNQPTHLAIDQHGRVYVVQAGSSDVAVFDTEGQLLGAVSRPARVASHFRPTGIATDRAGNLYLGDHCALHRFHCEADKALRFTGTSPLPADPSAIAFDLHGNLLVLTPAQRRALQFPMTAFEEEGTYLSAPLDSELYRCQWHRVVLNGVIPNGAQVRVDTFTAETPLDPSDLANLPETAWATQQRATAMPSGTWDSLITSPPGRFLYLRLTLRGNGVVTPRLEHIKLFFPRISLRRYLPAVFGENPLSADFTDRLLAIFDTIFRSVEEKVDQFALYLDPMSTPAERQSQMQSDFLTWLATWMGLTLDRSWDERRRRRWLKEAHLLYQLRGTMEGLRRFLLLYLGGEPRTPCGHSRLPASPDAMHQPCALPPTSGCACQWESPPLILEHFKVRRWLFVGEARLGEQAKLWGQRVVNRTQLDQTAQVGGTQLIDTGDPLRDPFHVYAHKFSVFIPAVCARDDTQRAMVQRLIALSKPAHTVHQVELVEPRFRIGVQSSIGLNTVVGRYPEGVTLDEAPLGQASVLGEPLYQRGGPSFEIGKQARVGTTTMLD